MSLFGRQKPKDPISDRAKALSAEIAQWEARIRELDQKVHGTPAQPRLRSTARPHEAPAAPSREPVFEQVDHQRVTGPGEAESTPAHYNELGVRKFDLVAAWTRLRRHFEGPPASNPKLVSYLASTDIGGVLITLTGTDDLGHAVSLSQQTDGEGNYGFRDLRPGSYTVSETQPAGYTQGINTLGTAGGTAANDQFLIEAHPKQHELSSLNHVDDVPCREKDPWVDQRARGIANSSGREIAENHGSDVRMPSVVRFAAGDGPGQVAQGG